MSPAPPQLFEKFQTRQARVAIVGLGYVGLPLALTFVDAGFEVIGIDIDLLKVEAISQGKSYFGDVSAAEVAAAVARRTIDPNHATYSNNGANAMDSAQTQSAGWLRATTDFAELAGCDAVSICVPTPLRTTGDPDMSYILSATENIARHIRKKMVIVLESTTFPGTTEEVVLPILCKAIGRNNKTNGAPAKVGEDFYLAFSPERIDPGRTDWVTRNTPKIIGGVTAACTEIAMAYYSQAIDTLVPVSSPGAAEMTKLFENTFRAVNIALANELLLMCDKLNLDAWEVIEAAATKPFGFMKFTPGPGLGGHCIPIDPHYLSWKLRTLNYNAQFIELASEINTDMPIYWSQKVQDILNEDSKSIKGSYILVLGVAYKRDVNDLRESPALDIIHTLKAKGAHVEFHDPHIPKFLVGDLEMASVQDLDVALMAADCVLIVTDHSAYDWERVLTLAPVIVDCRHVLPSQRESTATRTYSNGNSTIIANSR